MQVTLMFFGLQHSDTVNSDQILATSGVSAAALLLFCEDVIFLTDVIGLIRDYSSEEFVNSRKTDYKSKV